ncbi:MAG: nitric oxide reductase activation protein [Colwellia sp.]|jgi:nitric oxide reductase activation protein
MTGYLNHILINGKPHDIDYYEGRFGIEDTHQAITEANRLGIQPFCITIDQEVKSIYLIYLVVMASPLFYDQHNYRYVCRNFNIN